MWGLEQLSGRAVKLGTIQDPVVLVKSVKYVEKQKTVFGLLEEINCRMLILVSKV